MPRLRELRLDRVVAVWLLAAASLASAQEPAAPPAPAPVDPAATPAPAAPVAPAVEAIPVSEIAERSEQARTALRAIAANSAPDAEITAIAQEMEERGQRLDARVAEAKLTLARGPALSTLKELADDWRAVAADLARKREAVTRHAQAVEAQLEEITALRAIWDETRRAAVTHHRVPEAVVAAIDGVLAAIKLARKEVRERRSAALTLQNEIAQAELAVASLLEPVDREAELQRQNLLEPDAPPLWALAFPAEPLTERVTTTFWRRAATLREWALRERPRFGAQLAIFIAALGILIALRRSGGVAEAEPGSATALVFARPISAALIVALSTMFWLHPNMPTLARSLTGIVVIPVLWRLLPGLVGDAFRPILAGMTVLFVLGRLHSLGESLPVLERLMFTVQTVLAIAFALWAQQLARAGQLRVRDQWRRPIVNALRLAAALLVVSLGADAFGYLDLATLLTSGVLTPAFLGVALFAAVRIGDEVVAALIRTAAANGVRMAATHAETLRRRGGVLLRLVTVGVWLGVLFDGFGLLETVLGGVRTVFSTSLEVGTIKLSLGDLVAFGVVVSAAFGLSSFARFVLDQDVYPRLPLARGVPNAVSTFLHYSLLLFGFTIALGAAGIDLGRFSILAGAFGVGVGFGLQNVVNNFVSGLILLFERPVNVGDTVQIADVLGEVRRIGVRSSTLRTFEGADVIVPNANLISDRVVNWTLSDRRRRVDLPVGVAYGADPERVQALLVDTARKHKDVLSAPPPIALFKGFGESSLDFELRAWIDQAEQYAETRSDLAIAVYAALGEAQIGIPYPHREITLRTAPPEPTK